MGKYEKATQKEGGIPLWILAVIAVGLLAVLLFLIFGGGNSADDPVGNPAGTGEIVQTAPADSVPGTDAAEPEETEPELVLQILSTEEQGEYVEVTTSYGSFRYPFAFSDLIQIQAVEDNGSECLEFYVVIGDTGAKLFTVRFDDAGAVPLGAMTIGQEGEKLALTADVYAAPETLDTDGKNTYYAAQEIFNDVVISLRENENFVPEN